MLGDLTDEMYQEYTHLLWIKKQLPLFDSNLITGKMTEEDYQREMMYFISEIEVLEKKYNVVKEEEKKKKKKWRIIGKSF